MIRWGCFLSRVAYEIFFVSRKRRFMIRETIITAMESQGLTAYAVAKLAQIDPGVVKRYITGQREMQTDTLEKILNVLGLVIDYKS
jgi:predicted transcriptional regulator